MGWCDLSTPLGIDSELTATVMDWGTFRKATDKMIITNPAEMVESLLYSEVEAAALTKILGRQRHKRDSLDRGIGVKLFNVLHQLLVLDGSYRHGFELCLSSWLIAVQDAAEQCGQSAFLGCEIRTMGQTFAMFLRGFFVGGQQLATYGIWDVDFAEASRRLWRSMQAYGCATKRNDRSAFGLRDCHRRASFEMLHTLQTRAWGQVRARVLLTIGTLVPKEVCDEIFLFALAAEQIPEDPRVLLPSLMPGRPWRAGDSQSSVRPEYRCSKLLQDSEARDCS